MGLASRFNGTSFSAWINSDAGRTFRVVAGITFLILGLIFREKRWGLASLAWGVVPLSAGKLDVCYISAALGGPLNGHEIRHQQGSSLEGR